MAIIIPEILILEFIDVYTKHFWEDYKAYNSNTTIVGTNQNGDSPLTITDNGGTPNSFTIDCSTISGNPLSGTRFYFSSYHNSYVGIFIESNEYYNNIQVEYERNDKDGDKQIVLIEYSQGDTESDIAQRIKDRLESLSDFDITVSGTSVEVVNKETTQRKRSNLFEVFGNQKLGDMVYFEEAVKMLRNRYELQHKSKGGFTTGIGYGKTHERTPRISVLLPNEEVQHNQVGTTGGTFNRHDGTTSEENQHGYRDVYNLLITGQNENDVILLYHFLKTLFLMGQNSLTLAGLNDLRVGGADIQMDMDLQPRLYHRTVSMSFHYYNYVPSLKRTPNAESINFQGIIKDKI